MQEEGEPIDEFITSLYSLAESCEYATLHDEMIRNRIVVGVRDKNLSERYQLDESFTLEKAVKTVRQFEAVRKQQDDLKNPYNSKVNQIKTAKKTFQKVRRQNTQTTNGVQIEKCRNCGKIYFLENTCPPLKTTCNKCNALGHWESCCKANLPSTLTQNDGRQKWNKKQTMCAGMFTGKLKYGDVEIEEPIYVTYQMSERLLSGKACIKLKFLMRLNSLKAAEKEKKLMNT
ncbi:hypothetical protein LAZ67_2003384 [Cordylochernes scorpioides]|uniref:Uncharacterized protein n=1 Tax=Cordylochernes scorpioides TaxID=51811 RepID=A0ABY6K4I3_9ARAC|nr:hypothetical protein LAZ67_2003384 [Cordylochernes scorpioides]